MALARASSFDFPRFFSSFQIFESPLLSNSHTRRVSPKSRKNSPIFNLPPTHPLFHQYTMLSIERLYFATIRGSFVSRILVSFVISFDALKGRRRGEERERERREAKKEKRRKRKKKKERVEPSKSPRSTARIENQYLAAPPTRDRKGLSADGHW